MPDGDGATQGHRDRTSGFPSNHLSQRCAQSMFGSGSHCTSYVNTTWLARVAGSEAATARHLTGSAPCARLRALAFRSRRTSRLRQTWPRGYRNRYAQGSDHRNIPIIHRRAGVTRLHRTTGTVLFQSPHQEILDEAPCCQPQPWNTAHTP